jgi:hypothetical protein
MMAVDNAHIRSLLKDALDSALRDHVKHVFDVWMKDDTDQPARAATGVRNGIAAYRQACEAIDCAVNLKDE